MASSGKTGVSPQLSAADLVEAVPALAALADVRASTVRTLPGASLGFRDVVETARVARACVEDGAGGIVVTQGTDSLEETAYVLDLLWDRPEPLVVTGAMRHPSAPGADGPGNLWAAATVAVDPVARGQGCLVVFGDDIHRAREVAKVHSVRPAAFCSPGSGPVGWVCEGAARFTRPGIGPLPALKPRDVAPPEVGLVCAVLGDTGTQLRATTQAGVDGLVLAAMGAGHIPQRLLPSLEEAVERMPVVAASRTGAGPILRNTYAFPGSERDLHRLGLLDAHGLAPLKARLLLALALWCEPDRLVAEDLFRRRAAGG